MEILYSKISIIIFSSVIISVLFFFLDFQNSFFSNLSFRRTSQKICDIMNSIKDNQQIEIEIENINTLEILSGSIFLASNEKEFSCKINSDAENKKIESPDSLLIFKKEGRIYVQ